jgi:nucleotide-binding universal stress UspA family protein
MRLFQPENIVVPIEPADVRFDVLDQVIDLVGLRGTHVISVWPATEYEATVNWGTVDDETRERYALRDMRERLMGAWYADLPIKVVFGEPATEICRFARRVDADLIVMPTHQRTGFDRMLNGSVAERVVRKACCPVLISPISPRDDDRAAWRPPERRVPAGHRGGW